MMSIGLLLSAAVVAADGDAKIRYAWFPRFSPDGTQVLVAHGGWDKKEGGEAQLLAAKDGAVQRTFQHTRGVRSAAWATKGTVVVTGGYGQGVRGFNVKSQQQLFHWAGEQSVDNVRVTSDDKLVAASFGNGDIRLYDLPTRTEVFHFGAAHDSGVWGMALSPNDKRLASAGKDTYANVYDLGTRKKVHTLKHPGEVNGIVFSPDSKYLATGCLDSRVRIFDATTGERLGMFKAHDRGTITDLQFTSDAKLLATSGADGTVRLWDVSDLKNPSEKRVLKAHTSLAFGVAISPDDRWLVSAGWDNRVKMWDLKTGELAWTWKRE